jgi:hypothetical protein
MNYFKSGAFFLLVLGISCTKSQSFLQGNTNGKGLGNGVAEEFGKALVISQKSALGMPKTILYPDTVYSSYQISEPLFRPLPTGYEDKIISFRLPKGYMAIFAENSDGTGQSAYYVALDSAINADLPTRLQNNISYIRYIPINNPDKKGTASTQDATVQAFGSQWFYGWSLNRSSFPGQQFVPMTWGKGSCTDDNVKYLVERNDIDHLLSFNEPDNVGQSNIPNIDTAVSRYLVMQKTGLRLGAPVTTQGQAFGAGKWFTNFVAKAQVANLRMDFLPIHWYDWGNQTNNKATDSLTAQFVFNRFQTYVQNVHANYPTLPIWVTEFNANPNRSSVVVHEYFMKLATDWMNSTPYIERYAYFFPKSVPDVNADGTLTDAGLYWKNLSSAPSFSGNIVADGTTLHTD